MAKRPGKTVWPRSLWRAGTGLWQGLTSSSGLTDTVCASGTERSEEGAEAPLGAKRTRGLERTRNGAEDRFLDARKAFPLRSEHGPEHLRERSGRNCEDRAQVERWKCLEE